MAEIVDIHGKRYHIETWYATARSAQENQQISEKAFQQPSDDQTVVKMKKVLLDEAGELATSPIDVGAYLYLPSSDGFIFVSKVIDADKADATQDVQG